MEEIRNVAGDREAASFDNARVVTGWPAQDVRLQLWIVLGFHELSVVEAVHEDLWYMGSLNDDGSVTPAGASTTISARRFVASVARQLRPPATDQKV
ncbi:hypothetical protein [Streptomyces sp. LN785]|uniref:hypothetical protein n=1 Tax=Streptomyces sp. LN785 TaxID=3112983 RepID=UPI00371FDE79